MEPEFDELLAFTTELPASLSLSVQDTITLLLESDETSTEPALPELLIWLGVPKESPPSSEAAKKAIAFEVVAPIQVANTSSLSKETLGYILELAKLESEISFSVDQVSPLSSEYE